MVLSAAVFSGPIATIIIATLALAFLAVTGLALYRMGRRRSRVDEQALVLIKEARGIMAHILHPIDLNYVSYLTTEDRKDCEEWLEKVTKKGLLHS